MDKLTDRMNRLVATKLEELIPLFQDDDKTDHDVGRIVRKLESALPLVEDIKTEIADIQKRVQMPIKPEEKEEEEKDEEPAEDLPVDDFDFDQPFNLDLFSKWLFGDKSFYDIVKDHLRDGVEDFKWSIDLFKDLLKGAWTIIKFLNTQRHYKDLKQANFNTNWIRGRQEVIHKEHIKRFDSIDQLLQAIYDAITLCCQDMKVMLGEVDDKLPPDLDKINEKLDKLLERGQGTSTLIPIPGRERPGRVPWPAYS